MNLLELGQRIGVEGFLHANELHRLVELATGREVLEVGSYRGLSAWGMGLTAKSLVCVDTFRAASDGQRQTESFTTLDAFLAAVARYNHVAYHAMTSEEAERIIGQTFDMIFIDSTHTYGEVLAETDRWMPHLRSPGIMVFHDYRHADFPEVERALDERFGPAEDGTTEVTLRWVHR